MLPYLLVYMLFTDGWNHLWLTLWNPQKANVLDWKTVWRLFVVGFFSFLLFSHHVFLFPVCSVSCLSNDHFEAVSLSCVILQTHGVYFQIFPYTAWVKGDREKGHEAIRKVNQMRDELPAQHRSLCNQNPWYSFPTLKRAASILFSRWLFKPHHI